MKDYIPTAFDFDPDERGHFGIFGGRFVPETLMPALIELDNEYKKVRFDKEFWAEVNYYLREYVGRPSPLYRAATLSKELGAEIYLKREDLNHTGAHKLNHCMGEGLLAKFMGKKKIIA